MMDWTPLTRLGRVVQYWQQYAPIPFKKCTVCGYWFWNWHFWRPGTWRWGLPEYCSRRCCDAEHELIETSLRDTREVAEPLT